jgi:SET domain-containing protein
MEETFKSPTNNHTSSDASSQKLVKGMDLCNLVQTELFLVPCQWLIIDCYPQQHPATKIFMEKLMLIDQQTSSVDYIKAPWNGDFEGKRCFIII